MTGHTAHMNRPEIIQSHSSLLRRNPGWSLKLFEDDDQIRFIRDEYSEDVLRLYLNINPRYGAARADLFRYLLVYRCGGVYLDVKSTCVLPLDALLRCDDSLVLSQWDNQLGEQYERWGLHQDVWDVPGGEYQNWFFAAAPNNAILGFVIKRVLANISNYKPVEAMLGRNGILRTTGPIAWTRAIAESISDSRHNASHLVRIGKNSEFGLVYSIFDSDFSSNQSAGLHRRLFADHYSLSCEPVVVASSASAV